MIRYRRSCTLFSVYYLSTLPVGTVGTWLGNAKGWVFLGFKHIRVGLDRPKGNMHFEALRNYGINTRDRAPGTENQLSVRQWAHLMHNTTCSLQIPYTT